MTTTTTTTTYLFDSSPSPTAYAYRDKSRQRHSRKNSRDTSSTQRYYQLSDDDADGSASLTYSTASSVNSCSIAGESHDSSSFADIMRVLDVQDGKDLASFLKDDLYHRHAKSRDEKSTAESLAYSTDNESHTLRTDHDTVLHGTDLITTCDSAGNCDYIEIPDANDDINHNPPTIALTDANTKNGASILFSAAEPEESLKERRERKRRERRERQAQKTAALIRQPTATTIAAKSKDESVIEKNTTRANSQDDNHDSNNKSDGIDSPSMSTEPVSSAVQTTNSGDDADPEDLFQTWMVCLADAIKNFTSLGRK